MLRSAKWFKLLKACAASMFSQADSTRPSQTGGRKGQTGDKVLVLGGLNLNKSTKSRNPFAPNLEAQQP